MLARGFDTNDILDTFIGFGFLISTSSWSTDHEYLVARRGQAHIFGAHLRPAILAWLALPGSGPSPHWWNLVFTLGLAWLLEFTPPLHGTLASTHYAQVNTGWRLGPRGAFGDGFLLRPH